MTVWSKIYPVGAIFLSGRQVHSPKVLDLKIVRNDGIKSFFDG